MAILKIYDGTKWVRYGLDADTLGGLAPSNYALSSDLDNYLPLAGGGILGELDVQGNVYIGDSSESPKKLTVEGDIIARSGKIIYHPLRTVTQYEYTLPTKTGTIALLSDLLTTEVISENDIELVSQPAANSTTTRDITLKKEVQAGDKLKIYFKGGVNYEHVNAGMIEFELFSPSSNSLVGFGKTQLWQVDGKQHFEVTASVVIPNSTTSSQLTISIYTLNAYPTGAPAGATTVYLQKVERIR